MSIMAHMFHLQKRTRLIDLHCSFVCRIAFNTFLPIVDSWVVTVGYLEPVFFLICKLSVALARAFTSTLQLPNFSYSLWGRGGDRDGPPAETCSMGAWPRRYSVALLRAASVLIRIDNTSFRFSLCQHPSHKAHLRRKKSLDHLEASARPAASTQQY